MPPAIEYVAYTASAPRLRVLDTAAIERVRAATLDVLDMDPALHAELEAIVGAAAAGQL